MEERTLEAQTEEETEDIGQSETLEGESESEDESLDSLVPKLTESQQKEIETLRKKAKDFDGLVAKRQKQAEKPTKANPTEDAVRAVIHKDNEKKALRESVDPKSPFYLSDLVDDANFSKIVSYLPRSIDRSSPETVHRALRLAVKMWKEDQPKGAEKKPETSPIAQASASSGGERTEEKRKERTFIKKQPQIESWYKKPE